MGDCCKFLYGIDLGFVNFGIEKFREFSLVVIILIVGIRYELDEGEERWEFLKKKWKLGVIDLFVLLKWVLVVFDK